MGSLQIFHRKLQICCAVVIFIGFAGIEKACCSDWPVWRGSNHTGISSEGGWDALKLKDGVKPLWQANVGVGFSSITVSNGLAYTMGNVNKDTDVVYCFDTLSGKEVWRHSYPEPLNPKNYEGGCSATPTVSDGKVYTISKTGRIFCLDAAKGTAVWEKDLGIKPPEWGFAGSAMPVGRLVIFNVGTWGAALDKDTGDVVWKTGEGPSGYATAVPANMGAGDSVIVFGAKGVAAVSVADGRILWQHTWETKYDVNAADPIVAGDKIFICSGYNHGAALLQVTADKTSEIYTTKSMRSQLSGPVLIDGFLYGIDENQLACLDMKDGAVKWIVKEIGKGSLCAADGKLIVISEKGKLYIAQATPESFKVLVSAQVLSGKCWTMPVLANGLIYVRNAAGDLVCLDVRGSGAKDKQPAPAAAMPAAAASGSADWPQWRGPNRDGKSSEKGLLKKWPDGGPKMLWSVDGLGKGYSTVSISNGLIYTTGTAGKEGKVSALTLDGQKKWETTYGPEWTASYPSARSTPTIDNGCVYLISGLGGVYCLDAGSGDMKWQVNALAKFEGKAPQWGIAESPLIDGNRIFFTVGSEKASMIALDKGNGNVVWTAETVNEKSAYASPIVVARGNRRIVVSITESSIIGVDAADGKLLWRYNIANYAAAPNRNKVNPATPIYSDGCLFINSGYNIGGVKLQLNDDGSSVTKVWSDAVLDTHHGGVVLVDGFLYGSNWESNANGKWVCLDWQSGKARYETQWNGKGSITFADGMLYCYDEKTGTVGLVEPTPDAFKVVSSFKIEKGDGEHWARPVVCGGRLYIRHGDTLTVFDIKAG